MCVNYAFCIIFKWYFVQVLKLSFVFVSCINLYQIFTLYGISILLPLYNSPLHMCLFGAVSVHLSSLSQWIICHIICQDIMLVHLCHSQWWPLAGIWLMLYIWTDYLDIKSDLTELWGRFDNPIYISKRNGHGLVKKLFVAGFLHEVWNTTYKFIFIW